MKHGACIGPKYWLTDKYREHRKRYRKKDRDLNTEKNLKWERAYRERHRELVNSRAREYYHRNKSKCRASNKRYLKQNAIRRREYFRNRLRNNPQVRIRAGLGRRITFFLKNKRRFNARTIELLGCSLPDFIIYLQSKFKKGMTLENYGSYWQIDHIIPCAAFDLTKPEQHKRCFHFSNLQPLRKSENLSKSDKILTNQFNLL